MVSNISIMAITPTHINYYHLCQRKLWLFANGINMEHTSDTVYEGKLIHETTYPQRAAKYTEIDLGVAVIDYYDAANKIIHEIKKSDKVEYAHVAQVKYYIYLLKQRGIDGVSALLEYPKLRKTEEVQLQPGEEEEVAAWEQEIEKIIQQEQAPGVINSRICKKCSYYDYCYS